MVTHYGQLTSTLGLVTYMLLEGIWFKYWLGKWLKTFYLTGDYNHLSHSSQLTNSSCHCLFIVILCANVVVHWLGFCIWEVFCSNLSSDLLTKVFYGLSVPTGWESILKQAMSATTHIILNS